MPKIIELTVEIDIQRVSCPGVWLCQDGRVSLTVFALGTSYQTCMLPPVFPLMFKDIFYFRKRFQETCTLNNICCLLKDETIFCELVQWCEDCGQGECVTLAQYLGALNDVLFPPNMCSSDGVDLLMRRTTDFPGILSPKIEVATKVRIDEVWNQKTTGQLKAVSCHCAPYDMVERQRQVCHTSQYHRNKCSSAPRRPAGSHARPRSRSRSESSRSCMSFKEDRHANCKLPNTTPCPPYSGQSYARLPRSAGRSRSCRRTPPSCSPPRACPPRPRSPRGPCRARHYKVYNIQTTAADVASINDSLRIDSEDSNDEMSCPRETDKMYLPEEERLQKVLLESRFIEDDINKTLRDKEKKKPQTILFRPQIKPCICEICKRYHELFHSEKTKS